METDRHITLKRLAIAMMVRRGVSAAAVEVRCPASRYRVDAAGYIDTDADPARDAASSGGASAERGSPLFAPSAVKRGSTRLEQPRTVIVECKQDRADFLRDGRDTERLLAERERLLQARAEIERRLREEQPGLRRSGSFLFADLEGWDFGATGARGYRRVLRELRKVDRALHRETKFSLAAQYRLADRLYVLAPAGIVRKRETPPGWGLLECDPGLLRCRPKALRALIEADGLESSYAVTVRAPEHASSQHRREQLLRNIAVAATRDLARPSVTGDRTFTPDANGRLGEGSSARTPGRRRRVGDAERGAALFH